MPARWSARYQVAKLVNGAQWIRARAVGSVRREPSHRLVAPVVDAVGCGLRVELLDRHQLHRFNAEVDQVRYFFDEAGVGAALGRGDVGIWVAGEASDMYFVDYIIGKRAFQRCVASPIVIGRIDNDALQGVGRIVAGTNRRGPLVVFGIGDGQGVRIDQQLLGVEPQPRGRIAGSEDAVGVELPRPCSADQHVPILVGAIYFGVKPNSLGWSSLLGAFEQQQLDCRRRFRDQAEVHASGVDGGTDRGGAPGDCLKRGHRFPNTRRAARRPMRSSQFGALRRHRRQCRR